MADTPLTHQQFAAYLAEITYMDSQVGDLHAMLAQTSHENDILVLFTSEQGVQFSGCKWTNWDNCLHTSLFARWLGRVDPGKRTNAILHL